MSLPLKLVIATILGLSALTVTVPAEAHGWHRHHHHYHGHHRGRVHSYAPRYHWTPAGRIGWGCGLRQFVTYYGALAYREVCY